jgi:hypothetical protein
LVVKYNRRIAAELKTIEEMLLTYSMDTEIISILKIPTSTFYRYKARIMQDYAERFDKKRFDDVGLHTEQLRNRLSKYLKILESRLENCNAHETAALAQITVEVAKTLFDLDLQGLEILDKIRALDKKIYNCGTVGLNNTSSITAGDNT